MSSSDMDVVVYAPASIGNVSVGFDVLGAAVSPVDGTLLGDRVMVKAGDEPFSLKQQAALFLSCQLKPKKILSTTAGLYSLAS